MVMHLSCCLLGLSMPEAIAAATINAAASLGMAEDYGSIEVGKWGDLVLLDAPRFAHISSATCSCWNVNIIIVMSSLFHIHRWEHIVYQFGCHNQLIKYVVKAGRIVHVRQ